MGLAFNLVCRKLTDVDTNQHIPMHHGYAVLTRWILVLGYCGDIDNQHYVGQSDACLLLLRPNVP